MKNRVVLAVRPHVLYLICNCLCNETRFLISVKRVILLAFRFQFRWIVTFCHAGYRHTTANNCFEVTSRYLWIQLVLPSVENTTESLLICYINYIVSVTDSVHSNTNTKEYKIQTAIIRP
jgi:hypothetical protein